MTTPVIAQELIDSIIDYLQEDVQTLRAISLTCKACQLRAQYHIFADLFLDAQRYQAFLSLLEHSPQVAPLVKNVWIKGKVGLDTIPDPTSENGWKLRSLDQEEFFLEHLSSTTSRLPGVTSLRLSSMHWPFFPQILKPPNTTLSSIRHLDMYRLRVGHVNEYFDFIAAFPFLETLKWRALIYEADNGSVTILRRVTPLIVGLGELYIHMSEKLVEWLLGQSPHPRVHTFFASMWETDVGHLRQLCKSPIGATLESVHINLERNVSHHVFTGACASVFFLSIQALSLKNDQFQEKFLIHSASVTVSAFVRYTSTLPNLILVLARYRVGQLRKENCGYQFYWATLMPIL